MKVLIINTSEKNGGAAVAANRLTEALINNGVKAKMLVRDKTTSSIFVVDTGNWWQKRWCFLYERLRIFVYNRFSKDHLFKVSVANAGIDITKTPAFKEADVIHMHWINQGYLSLEVIRKILQSGKPVVWTMHDMWEMTAICHHAYDCRRYETQCKCCQFLQKPGANDLASKVFHRKQRLLEGAKNLHFVAVSEWLAERGRASALTGRFPLSVIPNSISLSRFTIIDRMDARTALDVEERYVIAFGAARIDDTIKGFDYLVKALGILVAGGRYRREDIRLLLFGSVRDAGVFEKLPVSYTHLGYVDDEDRLSLIYSASNVTVSSSLYETFGQTLIEAMACGSVPVSFAGSGQADIITHQQTGYLAERLSAESMADGIAWALESGVAPQTLRRSVSRRYAESVVANSYVELYHLLLRD